MFCNIFGKLFGKKEKKVEEPKKDKPLENV